METYSRSISPQGQVIGRVIGLMIVAWLVWLTHHSIGNEWIAAEKVLTWLATIASMIAIGGFESPHKENIAEVITKTWGVTLLLGAAVFGASTLVWSAFYLIGQFL